MPDSRRQWQPVVLAQAVLVVEPVERCRVVQCLEHRVVHHPLRQHDVVNARMVEVVVVPAENCLFVEVEVVAEEVVAEVELVQVQ